MNNRQPELKKNLSKYAVWSLAFGCIVGWGAFINPGKMFLSDSGVYGTAIAMFLGALVMLIISHNYAYMIPKYPKAGGEFTFTRSCFGKRAAYLCGWFLVAAYLAVIPMNATALGLIIDGLFGSVLKFGFHYNIAGFNIYAGEMLFTMFALIIFAFFSIKSVKTAGQIQTLLALILAFSVITLTIAALVSTNAAPENLYPLWGFDKAGAIAAKNAGKYANIKPFAHEGFSAIISSILTTLVIAPWAFVGFDTVPQAAEELNFPHEKVRPIMITAIFFGCFVYIANNTVTALALKNWPDLIIDDSETPWLLLTAAEKLLGAYGKILLGLAVLSAVLTGILGFYMAASRLMYSMSREGYLPNFFGEVDDKTGTPKNAILFCMIVSLSGPILGREALGWFVDMSSIGASVGFGFTCAAAYVTLKRLNKDKNNNILMRILSVMGAVFSAVFIFLQLVPIPGLEPVHLGSEAYIMLIIWIITGLLFGLHSGIFKNKK